MEAYMGTQLHELYEENEGATSASAKGKEKACCVRLMCNTVTKGRCSKKPVTRSLNSVAKVGNRSPKRVGNFSGSDFENFGEPRFGQRSSGKEEHVPIKKRRHLLQSPSPNPRAVSMRSHDSSSPQTCTSSPISEDLSHFQINIIPRVMGP
ncbi:uncharacterized protein Fot_03186 [Forsythia ovata]|uniref:Uncharacterized protein n=1 Tax=Forsythia ovata TaxID=205694 RepID=A0ABD1X8Z9_9LAMI